MLGAALGALMPCEGLGHPGPPVGTAPALGPTEHTDRTFLWVSTQGALYSWRVHGKPASCPEPGGQTFLWTLKARTNQQ